MAARAAAQMGRSLREVSAVWTAAWQDLAGWRGLVGTTPGGRLRWQVRHLAAASAVVLAMALVPEVFRVDPGSQARPVADFEGVRTDYRGFTRDLLLVSPSAEESGGQERSRENREDPHAAPENASEALKRYTGLKHGAERLNEKHLQAQDALAESRKRLQRATNDIQRADTSLRQARADKRKYRKVVDTFAGATYTGGHLDTTTLTFSGSSKREVLERAAALRVLAEEKNTALQRLASAVERADEARQLALDARERARASRDAAARHQADIAARKRALDAQVATSKRAYERLSDKERAAHEATFGEHVAPPSSVVAPGAAAQTAVDAAMSQRGKPYSYGAEGPYSYDCSGLTSWAFQRAGIAISRSSAMQSSAGIPVTQAQLAPGDLVFFYQPVSHVGTYVGGGMMVHAPTEGDVVKVADVMWQHYSGARRYS